MRCRLCVVTSRRNSSSAAPAADLVCQGANRIVLGAHSEPVQDESCLAARLISGLKKRVTEGGSLMILGLKQGIKGLGQHSDSVYALGK